MELANKLGARFALIVGEDELAAGRFALKNMSTGEQQSVAPEEIGDRITENMRSSTSADRPLASDRN
jgi:histidyl-tRNA synthetase